MVHLVKILTSKDVRQSIPDGWSAARITGGTPARRPPWGVCQEDPEFSLLGPADKKWNQQAKVRTFVDFLIEAIG
jgi:hypothetical protein